MDDLVVGEDGKPRCGWGASTPDYLRYHDTEWGRPVVDRQVLFEKLCLEGFQSGLSWLTILRKRSNFRRAFAGFDPDVVARFDDDDVARLLTDAGIVRHERKIRSTINNAQAVLRLEAGGDRLEALMWRFRPPMAPGPESMADVPSSTEQSAALAKELKARGFSFVGPTTVYAAMQAMGIVNDHLSGCHRRAECAVDQDRAAARFD
jgi:DNA-3-methyladenine glycosylase I